MRAAGGHDKKQKKNEKPLPMHALDNMATKLGTTTLTILQMQEGVRKKRHKLGKCVTTENANNRVRPDSDCVHVAVISHG